MDTKVKPVKKPNIVLILSDDQGAWATHDSGTPELFTPNLDRLGREGMRFRDFFCASPVCSPARASILTGRMPSAHGVHDWLRSGNVDAARFAAQGRENPYGGYADEAEPVAYTEGMPAYTDMLKAEGYVCALSGKWHLGDSVRPQHGFDEWYSLGKGGCFYYHPDIAENGDIRVLHGQYVTDLITRRACLDIERLSGQERPFYLSVHYTAPHNPWSADQHPKKWIDYYENCGFESVPDVPDHPNMTTGRVYGTPARRENLRGYFAAISAMDEGIGSILKALEEKKILDETLVIFMSDNGMSMGHHGIWGKGNGTFPMNMYDTAVKTPFIARCPALIANPGTVTDEMASALDLFPTFCELVGGSCPEGLPGVSFLPVLKGQPGKRENVGIADEYGPVRMFRTREWKLVLRYPYGPNELYHLESDPGENENLYDAPECAERVVALRRELEAYFRRYSLPEYDGLREPVTGEGQMCRAGEKAIYKEVYHSAPYIR